MQATSLADMSWTNLKTQPVSKTHLADMSWTNLKTQPVSKTHLACTVDSQATV